MINLKKLILKNCTCYYFNKIIKIKDFDLDNILIDEKSYEDILVFKISYKSLIAAEPSCIRFDKTDRFIRVYEGTRYLVLFGSEKYSIYSRFRYLKSVNSGITYEIFHNYAKIIVDSSDSLPLEKTIAFHVITFVKSVWNKDQNQAINKEIK